MLKLDMCCISRKAKKQAVSWWNISDRLTISQVVSRIRDVVSEVTFWFTAWLICAQSQHSEETAAFCSVTGQKRLACSLLGISVWEPAPCGWWNLLDLWSWWKCCWVQGVIYCIFCSFYVLILWSISHIYLHINTGNYPRWRRSMAVWI